MVEQAEARGSGERGMGGGGEELKKGPWTPAEDAVLVEHVRRHGEGNWNAVRRHSGLARCGKSCRLRWANHLRPNLKKGSFAPDEELLILRLHAQLGNKWARIAAQLPGRTDNEIKNYWNTRLKRRQRAGLPIYPPDLQEAVRFDRHHQQQHQAPISPRPLTPPPLLNPVDFHPPPRISLPPLPQNPFACQLGFGFLVSPLAPPPTPNSLFQQQHQIGPPPPLSPAFAVETELPSCQSYSGLVGGDNGQSSSGLLESLLQGTGVAEDMRIGELLALQAADEQVARWAQIFGDDGDEGIKEVSQGFSLGSATKLDRDMGTEIKCEPPGGGSPMKGDTSTLLDVQALTMSLVLKSNELASSLSITSADEDCNISSWPWSNMPGIR
ncbi:unnamed protein product [Musa acuminata subsp. burmannicoides]